MQMKLVSDNLQITRQTIENAIKTFNPEPIQILVKQCEAAGAEVIDINSGPLTREPEKKMEFLVEAVQSVTKLPFFFDTSNSDALKAGLSVSKNPAGINGFSLEPYKLEQILPLVKKYHTDIIGFLLFPNSQVPIDENECYAVATDLYREFKKAGLDDSQLIIDPVIAPVIWDNGTQHNLNIINVLRNIDELLGFKVRTIAGISNLTTGRIPFYKKLLMEQSFLPMLVASGLSMVLLNIFHNKTTRIARYCKSLIKPGIFSWADLD